MSVHDGGMPEASYTVGRALGSLGRAWTKAGPAVHIWGPYGAESRSLGLVMADSVGLGGGMLGSCSPPGSPHFCPRYHAASCQP